MMQWQRSPASPWRIIWPKTAILAFSIGNLAVSLCQQDDAIGAFDGSHPIHHLFNAHLLQPGEYEASIYGNVSRGVTNDLELGVQGLGYVVQTPLWNFSLKHRMFTDAHYQTSFNSHSFFFQSGSDHLLLSLHGIINSLYVGPNHSLNLGLMDGLAMDFNHDSESSVHLVTPVVGWDGVLTTNLAFSAVLLRPIYASEQQDSHRFGEGNRRVDFTGGRAHPTLAMATVMLSIGTFNFELGAVYVAYERALLLPYGNLFWRFHG